MRIGIVAPFNPGSISEYLDEKDVPFINNGATSVNNLVRSLLQEGQTLKVFTISNDEDRTRVIKGKNVEVFLIPTIISSRISSFRHHLLLDSFYVHQRLSKAIAGVKTELDVLHAHWTYDFALACIPFVDELPVFISVRDWAPKQYKLQTRFVDKVVWRMKLSKFRKVMGDERILYLANSQYTQDLILSSFPGSRTAVIPNPIKKELVVVRMDRKAEKYSFISIAQDLDDKGKNISPLMKAFAKYRSEKPSAKLHLVGKIDKEGYNYKEWEKNYLLEGVIFHGSMSHAAIMELMDIIYCMVHPSLLETFGNVLLEAMARGVVCIGGKFSGAVPYVLNQGKAGLLCDVSNPDDIFNAMKQLDNDIFYNHLSEGADNWIKKNFMSDVIAKQHIDLYQTFRS